MWNPFRRSGDKNQDAARVVVIYDPLTPAETGANILSRYRHPDSWREGRSTGKTHLMGDMVLRVEEIRLGSERFEQTARDNASAIRAWAGSVGLAPCHLTFDQQPGKAPYVVVPEQHFENLVLPHLQALAQPEQTQA